MAASETTHGSSHPGGPGTWELALGCWAFGGTDWGPQRDGDSLEAMRAALEAGVTHWDTALAYGGGHSERLCAEVLKDQRDRVYLATKGVPGEHHDSILGSLVTSLRNLRTDYLDLYYLHWPRSNVDMRPCMERLETQRQRGVIRAIGVSNFTPAQMDALRQVGTIDVHQLGYSLVWRRAEADVIPYCRAHGIAMAAYAPLAQGILARQWDPVPTFEEGDSRAGTVFFQRDVWPHVRSVTATMNGVARDVGVPLRHLATQWVASRGFQPVIVGARNAAQVRDTAAGRRSVVTNELLETLTRLSDPLQRHLPADTNIFKYYP